MLQPARRKYRKEQKGRNTGLATRGNTAPADGSDKPAEASGEAKPAVKRARKESAPAAAADGKAAE